MKRKGHSRHRTSKNYSNRWEFLWTKGTFIRIWASMTNSDNGIVNTVNRSLISVISRPSNNFGRIRKIGMGCGYSSTKEGEKPVLAVEAYTVNKKSRNQKKPQKINARIQGEQSSKLTENVKIIEGQTINRVNQELIVDILKGHFFFYTLSAVERSEIVKKMVLCKTDADRYVFKQGDLASAFFIIAEGKVQLEINGEKKKILQKGDYFGELALIYMAPRSASIKTLVNSQFWCITRTAFREAVEDLVKKNYALARNHINNTQIFSFLTDRQKDTIAYNMLTLKFENDEVIFKINEDANSFYIIVKGSVEINIPGKNKLVLGAGQSFGEQSFGDQAKRTGTAYSRGQTVCMSIGRDVIREILGDKISNISNNNVAKWALKRSNYCKKFSNSQIEKLLQQMETREYNDGEVVFQKDQIPSFIAVPIHGGIDDKIQGQLVGQTFLDGDAPERDYVKKQRGSVAIFRMADIKSVQGKKMTRLPGEVTHQEVMIEQVKKSDSSHIKLQNLVHVKKLGQGQFGKVYLVKESKTSDNLFAIKCIKKQEVINNKMEKIILQQKHILTVINSPLLVNFTKSFKDNHFIYFLMEYIKGYQLFDIIREIGILNKQITVFYISSLILGVEYLHLKNIIYRDLKPENIMVDVQGYLKLIDMGTAKQLTQDKGFRTFTIIGTPHYMAPEVMQGKGYTFSVDLWSIGIILYELLCGQLPFAEQLDDPYAIHNVIMKSEPTYPDFFKDEVAKKLIKQLLTKMPESRMPKGFTYLKSNPYFNGFNWDNLYTRKMKSPYIPKKAKIPQRMPTDCGLFLNVMMQEKSKITQGKESPIRGWDEQF